MAITKRPATKPEAAPPAAGDAFISGAPDAAADGPKRVRKGNKVQITLTIAEPVLVRVDELAHQIGQSRAATINLAVMQMLQRGLQLEGER